MASEDEKKLEDAMAQLNVKQMVSCGVFSLFIVGVLVFLVPRPPDASTRNVPNPVRPFPPTTETGVYRHRR
jgi:hypothetical protein